MQNSRSDLETLDISVGLSTTSIANDRPLEFTILVDGVNCVAGKANTEKSIFNFSVDLEAEKPHTLEIVLSGKRQSDTVVATDGGFVKDVLLNIDQITFNGISLGMLLWSHSIFVPDASNLDRLTECVNLGHNGRWQLPFETPVYLWLLENL